MSIKLESVDNLKTFIGKTDAVDDTLLGNILNYVSTEFEVFCNRKFLKQQRTSYFDSGKKYYALNAFPIDSTTTLTVTYGSTVQTLNSDYYVWEDRGLIEFYSIPSCTQPKEILIVWSGGFTETSGVLDVPDDLKYACVMQASYAFRRRKDLGNSSISTGDGRITISTVDLLPDVKKILNRYKYYAIR
jgi:hypothetical protein